MIAIVTSQVDEFTLWSRIDAQHMSEWEALFFAQPRVNGNKMKPVYQSQNKHSDGLKKDSLRAVYMNPVACIVKNKWKRKRSILCKVSKNSLFFIFFHDTVFGTDSWEVFIAAAKREEAVWALFQLSE